eukprot:TRINITY_DN7343_c0_g1_i3.p1 TRINITY_DN7343_c0_g1~~TRINITY_DN7343_c0_g1_i3.p1  ORF type:complete len:301 (-),score=26.36 TRINITY_DN7343_c0_g1_i3:155-1057(-)
MAAHGWESDSDEEFDPIPSDNEDLGYIEKVCPKGWGGLRARSKARTLVTSLTNQRVAELGELFSEDIDLRDCFVSDATMKSAAKTLKRYEPPKRPQCRLRMRTPSKPARRKSTTDLDDKPARRRSTTDLDDLRQSAPSVTRARRGTFPVEPEQRRRKSTTDLPSLRDLERPVTKYMPTRRPQSLEKNTQLTPMEPKAPRARRKDPPSPGAHTKTVEPFTDRPVTPYMPQRRIMATPAVLHDVVMGAITNQVAIPGFARSKPLPAIVSQPTEDELDLSAKAMDGWHPRRVRGVQQVAALLC